jgi:hypothetical protein
MRLRTPAPMPRRTVVPRTRAASRTAGSGATVRSWGA